MPNTTTPKHTLSYDLFVASLAKAKRLPNTGGWVDRHMAAMNTPRAGFETAIVNALNAWADMADTHFARYESLIGDDHFIGANAWIPTAKALRAYLNGETGRLDCGTLDGLILAICAANGVTEADL